MTGTPELIELLAGELKPVRRLRPPLVRGLCWIFVAVLVVALLAVSQGVRGDLAERLGDSSFALAMIGSAATAICAATAAFALAVPGRSRAWALLPLPPLGLWVASIGRQCLTHWVRYDGGAMAIGDTARCFATVVLTSLPLWLLMVLMQRRSGSLSRAMPMLAGSLAVAAMAGSAMNLLHQLDASVMIVLWNFGSGAAILVASAIFAIVCPATNPSLRK